MSDYLAAAGRRWYVLVIGLLVTVGLGVGATAISSPTYSARGLVLLLPPEDAVGDGGNPFLALAALDMPARIIVSYLNSPAAQAGVQAARPTASYEVAVEEATRGPVIAIEVTDSTPEGALTTLQDIAEAVPSTLTRLQQELEVPAEATISSMPLTMATEAEADDSQGTMVLVVAVGAGLAATLAATLLVDRLLQRRSTRRRAAPRTASRAARSEGGSRGDGDSSEGVLEVVDGEADATTANPVADRPRSAPGSRRRAR